MSVNRVISVLPSATEVLCLIPGGAQKLVGRSHECDYPENVQDRPVLTGQRVTATESAEIDKQVSEALANGESLYTLDEAKIIALKPDVILTQDLCEVCSIDLKTVTRLASTMNPQPKVVNMNPFSVGDILDNIDTVGKAVDLEEEAKKTRQALESRVAELVKIAHGKASTRSGPKPNIAWLEWADPFYVAGHWTPELIAMAGGTHPLNEAHNKSIRVSEECLVASNPTHLVICPCGFDLERTEQELHRLLETSWFKTMSPKLEKIALVDGNQMFNRPGPRVIDGLAWLVGWLNDIPEVIPEDFPWRPVENKRSIAA
eukprot:Clim_evm56s147 gene=Clim_evmTU56s147